MHAKETDTINTLRLDKRIIYWWFVITEENITLYRTFGGGAKVNGSFVTTSPAGIE